MYSSANCQDMTASLHRTRLCCRVCARWATRGGGCLVLAGRGERDPWHLVGCPQRAQAPGGFKSRFPQVSPKGGGDRRIRRSLGVDVARCKSAVPRAGPSSARARASYATANDDHVGEARAAPTRSHLCSYTQVRRHIRGHQAIRRPQSLRALARRIALGIAGRRPLQRQSDRARLRPRG